MYLERAPGLKYFERFGPNLVHPMSSARLEAFCTAIQFRSPHSSSNASQSFFHERQQGFQLFSVDLL